VSTIEEQPQVATAIPHDYSKRMMVFGGRSSEDLAAKVAKKLEIDLGQVTLKTFANGETYVRYDDSIRGSDAFIIQSGNPPVNDHLVELLIMIQAAKLASAKRITAVVPWYPYSRQDKKSRPREPITARLVADFLEALRMSAPSPLVTTWALVAISPSPEMTKPEPRPAASLLPGADRPVAMTVTTPGDSRS
jgi:hypothetical protein